MKLCDLETSKALQELGYDGECRRWYSHDGKQKSTNLVDDDIPAPRLDDAAYWLREKKGLLIYITYLPCSRLYCPHINDTMGYYGASAYYPVDSPNYDSALENSVEMAIEIIKRTKL